jgi:hypothetical protein
MNEMKSDKDATNAEAVSESAAEHVHFVYTYESAGIAEREGSVPFWLWIVVVLLLVWGVYYLVAYWNPPPTA